MQKFIYLGCFMLLHLAGLAQDFDKVKIDSFFTIIEKSQRGMGQALLYHQGNIIYQRAFGKADIEKNIDNSAHTLYKIGAISKTFTSAIIFKLVEQNKLSLDQKVDVYFPDLPNAANISVRDLLYHRSGLFNISTEKDYETWSKNKISSKNLLKKIQSYPPNFKANTKTEYSNTNYILLTFIIEKITKKDFATVLDELIAKPLGLKNTFFPTKNSKFNHLAASYRRKGAGWESLPTIHYSATLGAGGIISTPEDVAIFLRGLFKEGLFKQEYTRQMVEAVDGGLGMGIAMFPFYNKKAFGHNGAIEGFRTNASYMPKEDLAVVVFTNGIYQVPANELVIGMLSIYHNIPYHLPKLRPVVALEKEVLLTYEGSYYAPSFPDTLQISLQDGQLNAQIKGQVSFPLDVVEKDHFEFLQVGIQLKFDLPNKRLIYTQNGLTYYLDKLP